MKKYFPITACYLSQLIFIFLAGCSAENKWRGTRAIKSGITYICNPAQGIWQNTNVLILEPLITIGENAETEASLLNHPMDLCVDLENNIYISDIADNCVKVYDPQGNFLRQIGSRGEGPGELLTPSEIAISPSGKFYVHEFLNHRISIFSRDGRFFSRFALKSSITGLEFDREGNLFVGIRQSVIKPNSKSLFAVYDQQGQFIRSFGSYTLKVSPTSDFPLQLVNFCWLPDGNLLYCYRFPYEMGVYTASGCLKAVITRELDIFQKYPEKTFVKPLANIEFLTAFPDGKFLVAYSEVKDPEAFKRLTSNLYGTEQVKLPESVIRLTYDLYNAEGYFLQSFPVDQKVGLIIHVDTKGFVYTKTMPGELPVIKKCKLFFKNNARQ